MEEEGPGILEASEMGINEENDDNHGSGKGIIDRVGQEQIHGLLFEEKLSWQQIINDLIRTEQLDPWDIDITLLANKFLEKVKQIEEANFFLSSQVLLAASLLLRLKSEILLSQYIPSLDAVLFGRKAEGKKYVQERIELDEEVPGLVLRTPLPRFRKVTLEELMTALGQAIKTENRRIRKVIVARQQELETSLSLPRHRINIKDRINIIHSRLKKIFANRQEKLAFSELAGTNSEDRIATFVPLLHLDNQHKVWLEQHGHLQEIWILLKHIYENQNAEILDSMRKEAEEAIEKLVEEEKVERDKRKDEKDEEKIEKGKKGKKKGDEFEEAAEGAEDYDDENILGGLTGFGKPSKEIEDIENVGDEESRDDAEEK